MITSFYPMEDGIKFDVLAEYPGVDPKWTWVGIGLSVDGPKPPTQYILDCLHSISFLFRNFNHYSNVITFQ